MSQDPMRCVLERLARYNCQPKRAGQDGYKALCPAHDDHNPSLSVKRGDDGRALVCCHAGCSLESVVKALGLTMADLFPPKDGHPGRALKRKPEAGKPNGKTYPTPETAAKALAQALGGELAGSWSYHDGLNREVMRVLRFHCKDGKQYRPIHPVDGGWRVGDPPGKLPLYRLPELNGAQTVYLCEGEKAADAARSLGLIATTTAHGAKAVNKSDLTPLRGKDVVILPDHDEPGRAYAETIASALTRMDCQTTARIVHLPDLPQGGDIVEFIAGREMEGKDAVAIRTEIEALAERAELFSGTDSGIRLACLADIQPKPLEWVWPGRIVLGKLNTLAGDPGLGKSFVTMDIAARISTGSPWPDKPDTKAPLGDVLLLTAEDGLDDTIRPRLDAAGADTRRIHAITAVKEPGQPESTFNLARDIERLAMLLDHRPQVRLIIIDPITAYLGKTDSYKDAEVRGLLGPLSKLAERYNVAVLLVQHLNKSSTSNAQHRISGSMAFPAASRAVWQIFKDQQDPKRRLMLLAKMNIAEEAKGMAYSVVDSLPSGIGVIRWEQEPVEMSADEYVASSRIDSHAADDRQDAAEWLREVLSDGPVPVTELEQWVEDQPFSWATVKRAKVKAGIQSKREGFGRESKVYWQLKSP